MRNVMRWVLLLVLVVMIAPAMAGETRYIISNARVRSCAKTSCKVLVTLKSGNAIDVLESVIGDEVNGTVTWYRISVNGKKGYVHLSLTSANAPVMVQSAEVGSSSARASTTQQNVSVAPRDSGGGCPNMSATCSQLTCDQARACLAAGNGRLDKDGDGKPCESQCGG